MERLQDPDRDMPPYIEECPPFSLPRSLVSLVIALPGANEITQHLQGIEKINSFIRTGVFLVDYILVAYFGYLTLGAIGELAKQLYRRSPWVQNQQPQNPDVQNILPHPR